MVSSFVSRTHLNGASDFQSIINKLDSRGVQARSVPAWKETLVIIGKKISLFSFAASTAFAFTLEENRRMFWLEDSDLFFYFLKRYLFHCCI